jgi:hypothetical protein
LHPSNLAQSSGRLSHPLVSEAYNKEQGHDRGAIDGPQTPLLDLLESCLETLEDNVPRNLRERLRDDHDVEKVIYELMIAAGFQRLGHVLKWNTSTHAKQSEFIVHTSRSKAISIECKKRDPKDGYEKKASAFWHQLQHDMIKLMNEERLNYWVKISGRDFDTRDIKTLSSLVVSEMRNNENGRTEDVLGRYGVEFLRLVEDGGSITAEVRDLFPRKLFGLNVGSYPRDQVKEGTHPQDMPGPITNPKILRMEITDDPLHRLKGITRNLKDASKQLIEGQPNLVYLDVSFDSYEAELDEFDSILSAVSDTLARRHKQISVVVLTAIYPSLSLDGVVVWRIRMDNILNTKASNPVPKEFKFLGGDEVDWLPPGYVRRGI